jgi:hemerythrin-like domain-containing protein
MEASCAPVTADADVVAVLLETHACGRRIVDAALRILEDGAADERVVPVAGTMHRFLAFTSPLHELDEEQTVFPALRACAPEREAVETALRHVIDEHMGFDELRETLARHWDEVERFPTRLEPLREDLLRMTEQFARMLERHAEREERLLFPLVRKYVPGDVQAQMLAVMRSRRGM